MLYHIKRRVEQVESFAYLAIDAAGKEVKGSMEADNEDKVGIALKGDGLTPIQISKQNALNKDINLDIGGKPKARDYSVFCRQFVSMTQAGVTIIDALNMLSEQTQNKKLASAIKNTQISVEKGETITNSMKEQGELFPPLLINMVEAGERRRRVEHHARLFPQRPDTHAAQVHGHHPCGHLIIRYFAGSEAGYNGLYLVFAQRLAVAGLHYQVNHSHGKYLFLFVTKFFQCAGAVAPIVAHLYPKLQIDARTKHPFHVLARFAAYLLQHCALFADYDALVAFALAVYGGPHVI